MLDNTNPSLTAPVFKKCVRCEYSLRGLPANHACPECGLQFDERCALYKVTNPNAVIAIWACIFGGGWVSLKHLPDLKNFSTISTWDKVGVIAALMWFVFVAFGIFFLIKLYRRGQEVAITGDGLIIRLAGFKDDLIPWSNISEATVADIPETKPQIATIFLIDKNKTVKIGGVSNVFPTRSDAERFVRQINERVPTESDAG